MARINPRRMLQAALITAIGHATTACAQTDGLTITESGQGQVGLPSPNITELSGITYLGGDSYIVVSDDNDTMAPANIVIDRTTGQISLASIGTPINLQGRNDVEGVAFDSRDGSLLISDEVGPTITRHLTTDGSQIGSINVPGVYSNVRPNRGLESLSLDPVGFNLWTANEEALTVDGAQSTNSQGTIVRLQRFDSDGQPSAQYGYRTQPHAGGSLVTPRSGVSDVVALPAGGLIVMEREVGGAFPSFRNRLYLIDPSGATDTTNTGSLAGVTEGLVDKDLLYQVNAGFSNFEGVALGPMLSNGDFALVLVSDDGGGGGANPQNLITLRLSGIAVDGDINGDFVVDKDDLAVVLGAWGSAVTAGDRLAGDLDGDGQIGVSDLDGVLSNWSAPSAAPATVPEPTGLASIAIGALFLLGGRW